MSFLSVLRAVLGKQLFLGQATAAASCHVDPLENFLAGNFKCVQVDVIKQYGTYSGGDLGLESYEVK